MREPLVHGVKGELLTRNPALDPLAAISRECWCVFPRWGSSSKAWAMLDPLPHLRVRFSPDPAKPHHTGSVSRTKAHHRGRPAHPVPRFSSLEPSFSGAGKEAAYARAGRGGAQAADAGRGVVSTSPGRRSKRVNVMLPRAMTQCGVDELRLRNRVCCVKHREGGTYALAMVGWPRSERAAGQLKKTTRRPLKLIHNCGSGRRERETVVQKIRREEASDALITFGEKCHDQAC
jgi:hypothetical protein